MNTISARLAIPGHVGPAIHRLRADIAMAMRDVAHRRAAHKSPFVESNGAPCNANLADLEAYLAETQAELGRQVALWTRRAGEVPASWTAEIRPAL